MSVQLQEVPLFSGLSQRQLKRLARLFKERRFAAGRPVVKQGEMSGVGFFVISEGEASVTVDGAYTKGLGPGDSFGELALISQQERAATVTADSPLTCQVINLWDFRSFAKDNPGDHLEAPAAGGGPAHGRAGQVRPRVVADELSGA